MFKPKDRGMVCRIAGNITGNLIVAAMSGNTTMTDQEIAENAVKLAISIVDTVDANLKDPEIEQALAMQGRAKALGL